jgi:hypothetical protein
MRQAERGLLPDVRDAETERLAVTYGGFDRLRRISHHQPGIGDARVLMASRP